MNDLCPTGFISDCPARLAVEIMTDKWAVVVVWALSRHPSRHGELTEVIGGISRTVLTQTLRRLQSYGLVARTVRSPGVEYSLTDLGRTLVGPITVLTEWSVRNGAAITDFQEAASLQQATSLQGAASFQEATSLQRTASLQGAAL
jgi:DNA-binding HxlR family transcriptional regulator